jgi:tellurite methyltransferase
VNANKSVDFFDTQFRKQVAAGEFALNPFETACLPFIRGSLLDFGCGLGNLAIAAARRGSAVTAVDASDTAIARIREVAAVEHLRIDAQCADIGRYAITGQYDTIAAIGLLMFFPREKALALLTQIQDHVAAGGTAIVNTLIDGTTYMGMFEPGHYHLFGRDELRTLFAGWNILHYTHDDFAAPEGSTKAFATLVAQKTNT